MTKWCFPSTISFVQIEIPKIVFHILSILETNGYKAYVVGGAVRDLIINAQNNTHQIIKDFDFTTDATPEQIQALFPNSFYENTFGTVSITAEHIAENLGIPLEKLLNTETQTEPEQGLVDLKAVGKIHQSLVLPKYHSEVKHATLVPFEITTFRSESKYEDFRRPAEINWGTTLEEDLQRRDFTINALALKINIDVIKEKITETNLTVLLSQNEYEIIDPFAGIQDLEQATIRTVGNPDERFAEDALRMLRAIRFSVQLNMKIDTATFQSIIKHAPNMRHISLERISSEFMKMLASDFPKEALELLDDTGLLTYVIPELLFGKGVQQGGHHSTDVWTHALDAVATCPSSDPIVRLATLLHDIAKPKTYKLINGQPTFYNHEIIGARMAKDIAIRLRLSKRDVNRIFILVRYHMFYYQPDHTDAAIRRFMRNVGLENINDILDLREADRLGSGARKTSWRLEEMKQRIIEQLHQPFAITDLAINGTDIMIEYEMMPGPLIGQTLKYLFERVIENPDLNTRDTLLFEAGQYLLKTIKKLNNND